MYEAARPVLFKLWETLRTSRWFEEGSVSVVALSRQASFALPKVWYQMETYDTVIEKKKCESNAS